MRSSNTQSRRPVCASVGRLLVMLAALAGLFAMHGLSEHGTSGHGYMEDMPTLAMSAVEHNATAVGALDQLDAIVSAPMEHNMGSMGLCLAVLGVALLLWLLRITNKQRTHHQQAASLAVQVPHLRYSDPSAGTRPGSTRPVPTLYSALLTGATSRPPADYWQDGLVLMHAYPSTLKARHQCTPDTPLDASPSG